MFLENYKTLQAELAATKSALAAKTSELESLRSSSALTTPLSATPTSVVSRNPFHHAPASLPPPPTFSQRLAHDGFEVIGAVLPSSSRNGDASPPIYEDEDEDVEVQPKGKRKREVDAPVGATSSSSSQPPLKKSKSVAAPAPMASDAHPTRMKSAFKCICPCGDLTFVIGPDGGTGAMTRHRMVCDEEYEEEPRRDDFSLMQLRNKDKLQLVRTFEVRKMSEADVAALGHFGVQHS